MARETVGKVNAGAVRAVKRAIDIPEAVSKSKPSMSGLEIQKAVGLSRPMLYQLLNTLASKSLIRVHDRRRFSLDYAVGKLAQNWLLGWIRSLPRDQC
jgi:IclR family transcriptional regulator, acetate operon repressor